MPTVARSIHLHPATCLALLACVAVTACDDPDDEAELAAEADDDSDDVAPRIASEQFGGVAEAVWRAYDDPEVSKVSYASPAIFLPGSGSILCSAAMIGPNMMMTAAHCGEQPQVTASFLTYASNSSDAPSKRWENFNCKGLFSTWHSSDLMLYFCEPNAAGQNPGDKYGYLDFERGPLTVGTQLYSVWANPLQNPVYHYDVRFLSRGQITSTTAYGSFTTDPKSVKTNPDTGLPDWSTSHERPIAVASNLWCNGGASGSAQVHAGTHKIAVAPLSTGTPDGPGRWALSIAQYLLDGTMDSRDPSHLQSGNIAALGLTPANYGGLVDENQDGLFDIQVDVERLRGEARRDWYNLAFDSERRNALWESLSAGTQIDAGNRWARLQRAGAGWQAMLTHRRLNLPASGWYRVTVMTYTNSASVVDGLYLGLQRAGVYSGEWLPTVADGQWRMSTFRVQSTGPGTELLLGAWDNVDVLVSSISVVAEGSVMDFDTADERAHWRNDINGARARVVPRGVDNGGPSWAVRVKYDASSPTGAPVRNRQLALVGGDRYRICVDHRRESLGMQGYLKLWSNGALAANLTFTPAGDWTQSCTGTFTAPGDDNNLQFGVVAGTGSYLIDNVRIERQP